MDKKVIYNYSRASLEEYFISKGDSKFRAVQIFEAVYRQRLDDFFKISNIKKTTLEMLNDEFVFSSLKIITKKISTDGTIKFIFELYDKSLIETVLMAHDYGYSVCVTTQVGCNMGCSFCASGTVKKIRNLEPYEIVLQVLEIDNYLRKEDKHVSSIVIMGIGEPFDNYNNVLEFVRIINDAKGLEIGSRHITISTCGIVPKIYDFSDFPLQVNLAISLHFPTNEQRSKYMKINKSYDLEKLIESIRYYYSKTNRRVTFEYILLKDINDSIKDADNLCKLIKGLNCYVNLIPYNETDGIFKRTTIEKRDKFFDYLEKNNINAIVRKEQGHDIDAACGQLRVNLMKERNN